MEQKKKINEWIEKEDALLILFDACRYDFFEQEYENFLEGELFETHTPATWTREWFPINFPGKYNIAYYDPASFVEASQGDEGFAPEAHFEYVSQAESIYWDDVGNIPDEHKLGEDVMSHDWKGKRLVRVIKPHGPWVDSPITNISRSPTNLGELFECGKLTKNEMYEYYRRNLILAFKVSLDLIDEFLDREIDVSITGDHGDYLGEREDYFMHGQDFPAGDPINKVPWFEVEEIK